MRRVLIGGAALAVVAVFLLLYFLWWAPGPKPGPHTIVVEEGSTLSGVAQQLEKQGAIPGSARTYSLVARILGSGDPIQAGEFQIPKGMCARTSSPFQGQALCRMSTP